MVTRILNVVKELVNDSVTVLLVGQMVHKALSTADSAHVLSHGRVVLSGSAKDLASQAAVREIYLGSG
jgi:branched-chain amino acid transport system ATP-binding protein